MHILCYQKSHDSSYIYYDTKTNYYEYHLLEREYNFKHASCREPEFLKFIRERNLPFKKDEDWIIKVNGGKTSSGRLQKDQLFNVIYYDSVDGTGFNEIEVEHHYAHMLASSLFIDLPKNQPLPGIAIDGEGDFDRHFQVLNNIYDYRNTKITQTSDFCMIGHLFTDLGLKVLKPKNVEYRTHLDIPGKLMGLQSYGSLDEIIYNTCLEIGTRDRKSMNALYDELFKDLDIYNKESNFNAVHTCYKFLVDSVVKLFDYYKLPKHTPIAYGGGVALSIIANEELLKNGYNIVVCPAAADSGVCLGAFKFASLFLGFNINLNNLNLVFNTYMKDNPKPISDITAQKAAKLLADNKIVAIADGSSELGPRALGHRSILMNPSIKNGKDFINQKVKHREWWRPFGGSCIDTYFLEDFKKSYLDFYMLRNFTIKPEWRDKLNSICHIDNSSRLQIINKDANLALGKILIYFTKLTGIPALLNTSYNDNGKPIAHSRESVFECFKLLDGIDYLVFDDKIYGKEQLCLIKEI